MNIDTVFDRDQPQVVGITMPAASMFLAVRQALILNAYGEQFLPGAHSAYLG